MVAKVGKTGVNCALFNFSLRRKNREKKRQNWARFSFFCYFLARFTQNWEKVVKNEPGGRVGRDFFLLLFFKWEKCFDFEGDLRDGI